MSILSFGLTVILVRALLSESGKVSQIVVTLACVMLPNTIVFKPAWLHLWVKPASVWAVMWNIVIYLCPLVISSFPGFLKVCPF